MGITSARAKSANKVTGKKKRTTDSTFSATNSRPKKKKQRSATDHVVEKENDEQDLESEVEDAPLSSDYDEDENIDNRESNASEDTKNLQSKMELLTKQLEEVKEKYTTQQAELQELRQVKPKNREKPVKEAVKLPFAQVKRLSEFIRDDLFHDIKIVDPRFNSVDSDVMQIMCKQINVKKTEDIVLYKDAVFRIFSKQMGQRQNYIAQRCRKVYHGEFSYASDFDSFVSFSPCSLHPYNSSLKVCPYICVLNYLDDFLLTLA